MTPGPGEDSGGQSRPPAHLQGVPGRDPGGGGGPAGALLGQGAARGGRWGRGGVASAAAPCSLATQVTPATAATSPGSFRVGGRRGALALDPRPGGRGEVHGVGAPPWGEPPPEASDPATGETGGRGWAGRPGRAAWRPVRGGASQAACGFSACSAPAGGQDFGPPAPPGAGAGQVTGKRGFGLSLAGAEHRLGPPRWHFLSHATLGPGAQGPLRGLGSRMKDATRG